MAMVNPMLNLAVPNPNVKDSRWLTLEVCREFQRNKCTRTENECKFAHPPPHVEVQNGRVIACFDSIKGKCQRKDPPCKYLHPPQHLREQLLQNGRNNLILRNLQLQAAQAAIQPYVPNVIPMAGNKALAYSTVLPTGHYPLMAPPYMSSAPTSAVQAAFNPYLNASMPGAVGIPGVGNDATMITQQIPGVIPTSLQATSHKVARPDRLEPQVVEVLTAGKKRPRDPTTDDLVLGAIPGVVPPYKRMAVTDAKSGIPMTYQPSAIGAYQHAALMQLGQQPYIPVTWQLTSQQLADVTFAGHPPSMPRF